MRRPKKVRRMRTMERGKEGFTKELVLPPRMRMRRRRRKLRERGVRGDWSPPRKES